MPNQNQVYDNNNNNIKNKNSCKKADICRRHTLYMSQVCER